jgi:Serine acetyltransferase
MGLFKDFKAKNMSFMITVYRLFFDRGMSAVFLYRLSRLFYLIHLVPIAIIIKHFNIILNNCEIAYQADIGTGFRINHAIGIVMSSCKIGENFTIFQNSTIGKNDNCLDKERCTPIIGNNVTCYTGCVVGGAIEIGDNVKIGANSVVLKDVPSNSTVIGSKFNVL